MTKLPDSLELAVDAAGQLLDAGCHPDDLATQLYRAWYAAPVAESDSPTDFPDDLVAVLRAAHSGSERWVEGWVAEEVGRAGQVIARRGVERRVVERCDYVVPNRPGIVASIGAELLVPLRRDRVYQGWWFTHAPGWTLEAPEPGIVRFYWNIGHANVAALVRPLTGVLSDSAVPWMLKCATNLETYGRADVVVLYLPGDALDRLRDALDGVRAAASGLLRPGVPPLTFKAGRGFAVCDDPGTGESFGEHRCRLVAEGVRAASASKSEAKTKAVRAAVSKCFRDLGVPVERPYVSSPTRSFPWE